MTAAPCCSLEDKNTKQIYVQSIFIHYLKKRTVIQKLRIKKKKNPQFPHAMNNMCTTFYPSQTLTNGETKLFARWKGP